MSLNVTFDGQDYIIPETGETGWGGNTTSYLVAIAAGCLQKTGGSFSLSAEVNFGASFGLASLYFTSRLADAPTGGLFRLRNNADAVVWRNAANDRNINLLVNTSDELAYDGSPILTGTGPTAYVSSLTGSTNQVIVSGSTGAITLNLPQSINTGASPQFGFLGLGSAILTSSILSLTSTTLGFLPPRMTTTERDNISSPATGLFIYNTSTTVNNFFNGTSWIAFAAGGTINSGTAGRFAYYAGTGTTISDQVLLSTNGTNLNLASGQLLFPDGTALLPSISFTTDPTSGMYLTVAGNLFISANGVQALQFGSNQQVLFVDGAVGAPSSSFDLDIDSGSFRLGDDNWALGSNGAIALEITADQQILKPAQVSFSAIAPINTANVTGDGSAFTVEFDATRFDRGSNFNTSTFLLVAPVTGLYQLNVTILITGLTTAHTTFLIDIITSNRTYRKLIRFDSPNFTDYTLGFSVLADMDASDTAFISVEVAGGAKVVEVGNDGSRTINSFSGFLVA